MHDSLLEVLIKIPLFVASDLCQDGWWEMHIRQGVSLEKKHGLNMGRITHSNSGTCVADCHQEIGRQNVNLLLLYMVCKVPGEYHTS